MPKILLALLVAFCAAPATALAHPQDPAILAESYAIADRWAASVVPDLPNYCANGKLDIEWVADDGTPRGGAAHGWVFDAATGKDVWDHTKCKASIEIGLSEGQTCYAIAHEQMHFIWGPEHTGPLDPASPGPVECWAAEAGRKAALAAAEAHADEVATEAARCKQNQPCWVWADMGDQTRRITLKGAKRSIKVGYYRFGHYAAKKRIDWKRTKKMRGDFQARGYYEASQGR